jgi:hypothetical protein
MQILTQNETNEKFESFFLLHAKLCFAEVLLNVHNICTSPVFLKMNNAEEMKYLI